MFQQFNQILTTALHQNDTLIIARDYDEFRIADAGHLIMIDDVRYSFNKGDFSLSTDGSGDITMTWLNAATIALGKTLRIGVAYVDIIIGGGLFGTGTGGGGAVTVADGADVTAGAKGDGAWNGVTANPSSHSLLQAMAASVLSTTPQVITSPVQMVDVTFTADTSIFAAGDVIADSQIMASIAPANDIVTTLMSMTLTDEDDQGAAMTVYFLGANVSVGVENAAPSITDANDRVILGYIDIAAADWKDLGGARVVTKTGPFFGLRPIAGSRDVYVAIVNGAGTPTFTVNGLRGHFTAV